MAKHEKTIVLDDVDRIRMICAAARMTGGEWRERFGMKNVDWLKETVNFGNGVEADIKAVIGYDDDGNWMEDVFFKNGTEVACSDPENEFFGQTSEFEIGGETYVVNVHAEINGSVLKTQKDVEEMLAYMDREQAPSL